MYVIATLSVYPHRASLKNMPGHGGIRTYDLWNASPMLCELSYAVRSIRALGPFEHWASIPEHCSSTKLRSYVPFQDSGLG